MSNEDIGGGVVPVTQEPAAWLYEFQRAKKVSLCRVISNRDAFAGWEETPLYDGSALTQITALQAELAAERARGAAETGWLIEHEDEPKWLTLKPGEAAYEVCWTKDSIEALRFARREDADDYATTFMEDGPIRITEHIWEAARASLPTTTGEA